MFVVDLGALRDGEIRLRREVPPDHPLWEGIEGLACPVAIDLTARDVGSAVWVDMEIHAALARQCRRCLVPVRRRIDQEIGVVFQPVSEIEDGEDEVYTFRPGSGELDLSAAVREQVLLAVPSYVTCREECRGLCAQCGVNRNEVECDCRPEAGVSPWDALKDVRFD